MFAGKLGQQVGAECVRQSMMQRSQMHGGANVDDEGTPTQRNAHQGVLKGYMIDKLVQEG